MTSAFCKISQSLSRRHRVHDEGVEGVCDKGPVEVINLSCDADDSSSVSSVDQTDPEKTTRGAPVPCHKEPLSDGSGCNEKPRPKTVVFRNLASDASAATSACSTEENDVSNDSVFVDALEDSVSVSDKRLNHDSVARHQFGMGPCTEKWSLRKGVTVAKCQAVFNSNHFSSLRWVKGELQSCFPICVVAAPSDSHVDPGKSTIVDLSSGLVETDHVLLSDAEGGGWRKNCTCKWAHLEPGVVSDEGNVCNNSAWSDGQCKGPS